MTEETLFDQARNLPEAERIGFLDRECAGQPELRGRVEALLAADSASRSPLDVAVDQPRGIGDPAATGSFRPSPSADEVEGALIAGRYKLRQQIGEGGMGAVWMADQTEPVKRKVAVKLIRVERGHSRSILARFEAERQAIALMDHPHIAKLLDAGTTETGSPYFVMELVKGVPLVDFCDQHRLTIPDRLNLFTQICSAVQHAHQKGIIHRDLKPGNILVESHDGKPVPKVIDFGLAKATGLQLTEHSMFTAFGTVMGTPLYMAPEQASFNAIDVDTRADVYALGVILYELLTGTTPITRDSLKKAAFDELMRLVREQEAPAPSSRLSSVDSTPSVAASRQIEPAKLGRFVKGELDWIVMKALSKERERRYESATGFSKDIERFMNHEPVQAGPPSARYRFQKFVRRNRGQVVAASLVLTALVAGIVGTTWGLIEARKQEREASAARDREAEQRLAAEAERDEKEKARKTAVAEKERADREKAIAEAVKNFMTNDVFGRAGDRRLGQSADIKARTLLEEAAKTIGEKFGNRPEIELEVRYALGKGFLQIGLMKPAMEQGRRLLELCRKLKPKDDPTTLEVLKELAYATAHSDQSLAWSREVFEAYRLKHGDDHILTAEAASSRIWLLHQRDPKEAMRLCEYYLPILREKCGATSKQALSISAYKALLLTQSGKIDEALTIYRQVHDAYEQKQTDWKLRPQEGTWHFIAGLLLEQRKYQEAIPLYLDDIERLSRALGADHSEVTFRRSGLANAYWFSGDHAKAGPAMLDVTEGDRRTYGPRAPWGLEAQRRGVAALSRVKRLDVAVARADAWAGSDKADDLANAASLLSMVVQRTPNAAEAEKLRDRAMQLLNRAVTRGWDDMDRLQEFIALAERKDFLSLAANLRSGKPSPLPSVLTSLANSARSAHKYAEAVKHQQEAIRLQEAEIAKFPGDESLLEALGNFHDHLGESFRSLGDVTQAVKAHLAALNARLDAAHRAKEPERKFVLTDQAAWSHHNVGVVYFGAKEYEKSVAAFREAVGLRSPLLRETSKMHPYHYNLRRDFDYLGKACRESGKLEQAAEAFRQALAISSAMVDEDFNNAENRSVLDWSQRQLAAVLMKLRNFPEARDIYRKNLELYRKTNESGVLGPLMLLGTTLLQTGEWQEAETILKECVGRQEKQIPDQWPTFNTYSMLGGAFLGQKKYAEAEPLLVKGYEGLKAREKKIPPDSIDSIPLALDRLIEWSSMTNKPDDAAKYRELRAKHLSGKEVEPTPKEKK
ncbi:MAG: tetratricopeptide repeat protein [Gemmataceae bacterium]